MTTQSLLYTKIQSLPEQLQEEAMRFIEFLTTKWKTGQPQPSPGHSNKIQQPKKVHPKAGFLKGTFIIKEGFDDPLEDFKDYM